MKRRLIAAFAAVGLVATMTGLGSIPAMADDAADPTTTSVDATTTTTETESAESTETATTETVTTELESESTEPETTEPADTTESAPTESAAGDVDLTESESTEPETTEFESTEPETTESEATEPESSALETQASLMSAETFETLEEDPWPPNTQGVKGELWDWFSDTNHETYWEDLYPGTQCFKDQYGSVVGKTVVLNAINPPSYYVVLAVKGGNLYNAVTENPLPGVGYASPPNNGGQQSGVSHWIVCIGQNDVHPEASASVKTFPATCSAHGTVAQDQVMNATFGEPVYDNGTYTIVATATGNALFPDGPGVSDDGTTKTFTGQYEPQKSGEACDNVSFCHAANADQGKVQYIFMADKPPQSLEGHMEHAADILPVFAPYAPEGKNLDTVYNGLTGAQWLALGECPDTNVKAIKPEKTNEECVDGSLQQGEISVSFEGGLAGKIRYHIVGPGTDIYIEGGDPNTVLVDAGDYTVTAEAIDPYHLYGKSSWEIHIKDANCKVYPDPAYWSGEQCVDGVTVQGWVALDYSGDLPNQIQYRITGENGFDVVVQADGDTTYYDLDAGNYTVTVEPLYDWVKVKGDSFPVDITIDSATNCQCYVPPTIEKDSISALVAIDPVCAEAEVSVTGPTCDASGELKLGDAILATWGEPVIENGHYTVVATADDGYRFEPGAGVSDDGFTKTFEGDLPAKLAVCGDLTTLALTGANGGGGLLALAGLVTLLGLTGVVVGYRRERRVEGQ